MTNLNTENKKFDTWMEKVDNHLVKRCGMTSMDLPDCEYMDMFESGYTPREASDVVLEELDYEY